MGEPEPDRQWGQEWANGAPMHGFDHSASVVAPPNSIVVFGG
jgi:hypothetical protein